MAKNNEEKYKIACQEACYNFPETLKQAKFKPLLTALVNGVMPTVVGVEILREGTDVRFGSLTTELPLPKAPTQIFCGSGLFGTEISLYRQKFCLVPSVLRGSTVITIIHRCMDGGHGWTTAVVSRESRVLLGITQVIDLPYDMRLWDEQHGKDLLSLYLKVTTNHLHTGPLLPNSMERTNNFMNAAGAGKLVRIRQLNLQPGKQKKTKADKQAEPIKSVKVSPKQAQSVMPAHRVGPITESTTSFISAYKKGQLIKKQNPNLPVIHQNHQKTLLEKIQAITNNATPGLLKPTPFEVNINGMWLDESAFASNTENLPPVGPLNDLDQD